MDLVWLIKTIATPDSTQHTVRHFSQLLHNQTLAKTKLNPKLGRPYFPKLKPQTKTTTELNRPSVTFSQLLHNQTQPNSVFNLISTQLEDSCQFFFFRFNI